MKPTDDVRPVHLSAEQYASIRRQAAAMSIAPSLGPVVDLSVTYCEQQPLLGSAHVANEGKAAL